MSPVLPEDSTGELTAIGLRVIEAAARLGAALHPRTTNAIAELLRPMNSYYSNLIEGHDTHPLDIDRALHADYSADPRRRSLQLEAQAHITLHRRLGQELQRADRPPNLYDAGFWCGIHQAFYEELPADFRVVPSATGQALTVVPGALRKQEVRVGHHVGPAADRLDAFVMRFAEAYDPRRQSDRVARVVAIAAAHHRLAWIHPFLDGNGRVGRLLSDALLLNENLDAGGLWSLSRGLARNERRYKQLLAAADQQRQGDYDGRGNLSNRGLVAFCRFFLETALDQIEFMTSILNIEGMLRRIHAFVDLQVAQGRLRTEARWVLELVFLKGEIGRREVERVTGLSDKTAKNLADTLLSQELLTTTPGDRRAPYRVAYPLPFSPVLFTGLFPRQAELDMLAGNRPA